jgi:hypothetical protein
MGGRLPRVGDDNNHPKFALGVVAQSSYVVVMAFPKGVGGWMPPTPVRYVIVES